MRSYGAHFFVDYSLKMMYTIHPPYLIKKAYPSLIWRKNKAAKKIYLTFDDGPVPFITTWVLDVLKEEQVSATFFCVGKNVVLHPEIYTRILKENHRLGNHTYTHLNGWNSHTNNYLDDINKCAMHVKTNLFRPPYGRIKKSQINQLKVTYSIIMWDVLTGDYDKKITPEKCLHNAISNIRNGSIVVFHDSDKAKINMQFALPRFIKYAKEQGFEFDVL